MPKVTWQSQYDDQEPLNEKDVERDRIRELRWEMDIDADSHYTLDELEDMYDNCDSRDHEG